MPRRRPRAPTPPSRRGHRPDRADSVTSTPRSATRARAPPRLPTGRARGSGRSGALQRPRAAVTRRLQPDRQDHTHCNQNTDRVRVADRLREQAPVVRVDRDPEADRIQSPTTASAETAAVRPYRKTRRRPSTTSATAARRRRTGCSASPRARPRPCPPPRATRARPMRRGAPEPRPRRQVHSTAGGLRYGATECRRRPECQRQGGQGTSEVAAVAQPEREHEERAERNDRDVASRDTCRADLRGAVGHAVPPRVETTSVSRASERTHRSSPFAGATGSVNPATWPTSRHRPSRSRSARRLRRGWCAPGSAPRLSFRPHRRCR